MIDDLKYKIVSIIQEKARICYGSAKTAGTSATKKFMEQKADVYLDCVGIVKKIFEDYEK